MLVHRAHKIKLDLSKEQVKYFACSAGVARFAYNWTLRTYQEQYKEFKNSSRLISPTVIDLRKEFNSKKKTEFSFVTEVSKYCSQDAQMRFGEALNNFFKKQSKFPTKKTKLKHNSFYLGNDVFTIVTKTNSETGKLNYFLKLPLLKTLVKLTEKPRFEGKVMSATFSKRADNWFVSLCYETDLAVKTAPQVSCGVDVGISSLLNVADDTNKIFKCDNPKAYRKNLRKLKYLQRCVNRKQKGSNNKKKAIKKLAKFHERIANIRKDNLHKLTTDLTKSYNLITIEDLNVKGMMKNHKLAGSIADASFYMFKQMLEYKTQLTAGKIRKAERFYPSSKLCSVCNVKNDNLKLSNRSWTCSCGAVHDRDENAAKNLLKCPDTRCVVAKVIKEKKPRISRKSLPIADGEVKLVENKGSTTVSNETVVTLSMKQEIKKIKSKSLKKTVKQSN